jgi:hypothetical protein
LSFGAAMVKKRRLDASHLPAKKRAVLGPNATSITPTYVESSGASSSRPSGEALIAHRVSVLWDDDGKWYNGIITDYRVKQGIGKHQIVYDVADGGQIMRTISQAQGLLGAGVTTHEWLIFEAGRGKKIGNVVKWKLIEEDDELSVGSSKPSARGARKPMVAKPKGPGSYARNVGRGRGAGGDDAHKRRGGPVRPSSKRYSPTSEFDDSTFSSGMGEFGALDEMGNENDFVNMIDDIDDPGESDARPGRGGSSALDTSDGQWGNLFLPFDIGEDDEAEDDLQDSGFGTNFSQIFGADNDYNDGGGGSDNSDYDSGGEDFDSLAASAANNGTKQLGWQGDDTSNSDRKKGRGKRPAGGPISGSAGGQYSSSSHGAGAGAETSPSTAADDGGEEPIKQKVAAVKEPEYFTLQGSEMTKSWMRESGFEKPIVVKDVKDMGMTIPDPKMDIFAFCNAIGDETMTGLRVKAQSEIDVKMSDWAKHFSVTGRPKDDPSELRLPTLAINGTELHKQISVPSFVETLDWSKYVLRVGNDDVHDDCRLVLELGRSTGLNKNWDSRRHFIGKNEKPSAEDVEAAPVLATPVGSASLDSAAPVKPAPADVVATGVPAVEEIKKVEVKVESPGEDVIMKDVEGLKGGAAVVDAEPAGVTALEKTALGAGDAKALKAVATAKAAAPSGRKGAAAQAAVGPGAVGTVTTSVAGAVTTTKTVVEDSDGTIRTDVKRTSEPTMLCKMRTEGTYSDFHIDEAGSATWYYAHQGETWVYFIPPSVTNLEKYEKWYMSDNQTEIFFGDLVSDCFKLKVVRGNLLVIPAGWIHAMYARSNSVLLGSSFSNTLCLTTQIRVHKIERSCHLTPASLKNVFWHVSLHFYKAMLECSVKKRQFRRRRGQIEREGTKLSKTRENRQKSRAENQVKLKRIRILAEQKIKALKAMGGMPNLNPVLPPSSTAKAKSKGKGGKKKKDDDKKDGKKKDAGNAAIPAESASGEAKTGDAEPKEAAEKKKPVQLTPLQLAKKECDDAIMQRDYLEREIQEAEEAHRAAVGREKDLRMRQKIEMTEMTEGQLSIAELRELMRLMIHLRKMAGPENAWKSISPPGDSGGAKDGEDMAAQNASKLKSDIRRANEARAAGLLAGSDGMDGVRVGEGDTSFIKYHHRPMPKVIRFDVESDKIPDVIMNALQLLDDLDRLFWFQRAHACAKKGVPAYVEDFAELDEDDQAAKVYEPKNPKYKFLWDENGRPPGIGKRGVDMKGLCKCHLKKCLVCRNCEKRHCWCPGGPLDPHAPPVPKKKPKPKKKPPPVVKPPPAPKPPRKGPVVQKQPKPKLTKEQEQALVRMKWRRRLALDTVQGTAAAKEAEEMTKWRVKNAKVNAATSGVKAMKAMRAQNALGAEKAKGKKTGSKEASGADHIVPIDASGQRLISHRASCHRCGNLRKKTMKCSRCPHVFCQKCGEKMQEEHGVITFKEGCPVCKELCCCGVNRSADCIRKFHCYKKCPAMKKLGKRGAKLVAQAAALAGTNEVSGSGASGGVANESSTTAKTTSANVTTTASSSGEKPAVEKVKPAPAVSATAVAGNATSGKAGSSAALAAGSVASTEANKASLTANHDAVV